MYSLTKITSQLAELASAAIPHLKFSPSSIILSQDFSAQMPPSQRVRSFFKALVDDDSFFLFFVLSLSD
ncbi:hypothetical protein ACFX13_032543 [Malus domestica]